MPIRIQGCCCILSGIASNLPMVHCFDCVGHCIFYGIIIIIIISPYCPQWDMGPQFSMAWYDKIKKDLSVYQEKHKT